MSAKSLDKYFSDTAIVRILCDKRLQSTTTNRHEQFMAGLTCSRPRHVPVELDRLLPPRRQWPRLGRVQRASKYSDPLRARAELLARYVLKTLRSKKAGGVWVRRLRAFIADIRDTALKWSSDMRLTPRQTIGIPKVRPGSKQKYRLVSIYGLREAVLSSGFAAFLRGRLEPHLGKECLAYRAATRGSPPITHHDAIARIRDYAAAQGPTTLWVAECDLQGFFDNLKHSTVRKSIKTILRSDSADDRRARAFVESFLTGYSFAKGYDEALGRLLSIGVSKPDFGRGIQPGDSHTGVAQGSAISCILANVVLFRADREALRADPLHAGLFLRYSDDTIFIAPSRQQCASMLGAYLRAVRGIGLPAHKPTDVPPYGTAFWRGKSKRPYKWSMDGRRFSVPWVAFVGYHVRRDLMIRARPSSITKELNKQLDVTDHVVSRLVKAAARKKGRFIIRSVAAIRFRAMQHMVAFSVGRPQYRRPAPVPDTLCWARGFKMLKGSQAARFGLARLDRGRQRALERLVGRVHGLIKSKALVEGKFNVRSKNPFKLRRPGRPFSYFRQFL
jgi:reverse transcriptase-like protein